MLDTLGTGSIVVTSDKRLWDSLAESLLSYMYNDTGLESRCLGQLSGDLCSIRQISHLKCSYMTNMQHHMAMPCGHTPNHTHIIGCEGEN